MAGGKLWFTEQTTNSIGILDPADPGHPQSVSLGASSGALGITTGPDGNVWFTQTSKGAIGMLNISDPLHPHIYVLPKNPTRSPSGITVAANQNGNPVIWYSDPSNNSIGMIDPNDTGNPPPEIPLPNSLIGGIRGPIVGGPDGKLWFTEARYDANLTLTASAIGAYDPRTGQWSQVSLPSGSRQAPFGITRGR